LHEYRWKLNPNKCVFSVPSGKLLGFIISHRGSEANPEKISAITSMKAPTCIKDVKKLTGCMVALNRFISKLVERGLPFFKLLKHQEKFVWTTEADQALAQLKDFLSKPPVLTVLAKASNYCSTSLRLLTWLVLPLSSSGRKTAMPTQSSAQSTSSARSYQSPRHATSPYRSFCTPYSSPRGSYDTTSMSTRSPSSPTTRSATSCGTKMPLEESPSGQSSSGPSTSTSSHTQLPTPTERPEHWVMYFDGSLNLEGVGAGVLLISPTGEQLKYVLQIFWKVSNNEA
jgi:hypothetical protein